MCDECTQYFVLPINHILTVIFEILNKRYKACFQVIFQIRLVRRLSVCLRYVFESGMIRL